MSTYCDYDDDRDGIPCPRCYGDGTVDCHCGGDLCVCENYGERDCPTCYGEGEVSESLHARYRESERAAYETMQRVWAEVEDSRQAAVSDDAQPGMEARAAGRNAQKSPDTKGGGA